MRHAAECAGVRRCQVVQIPVIAFGHTEAAVAPVAKIVVEITVPDAGGADASCVCDLRISATAACHDAFEIVSVAIH